MASGPSWVSRPSADSRTREVPSSASDLTFAVDTAFLMETSLPASARTARLPAALPIEISSSVFQAWNFAPGSGVSAPMTVLSTSNFTAASDWSDAAFTSAVAPSL